MQSAPLAQLRDLCLALPETTQTGSGEDPTFSVRGQTFAAGHRVGERQSVWFKATTDAKQRLLYQSPRRYFQPRYVGRHGWLGAWLDEDCDWTQLAGLLRDSYRTTAPKPLIDMLAESVTSALPLRDTTSRPVPAGRRPSLGIERERRRRELGRAGRVKISARVSRPHHKLVD